MKMRTPKAAGFTLIELLVAVTILGILIGIAIPSYAEYVTRGKRAEGRAALLASMQQMQKYFAANNGYIAFNSGTPNGFATTSGDNPTQAYYNLTAAACAGSTAAVCVVISAAPRVTDTGCGALSISTAGVRDSSVAGAANRCWQR